MHVATIKITILEVLIASGRCAVLFQIFDCMCTNTSGTRTENLYGVHLNSVNLIIVLNLLV